MSQDTQVEKKLPIKIELHKAQQRFPKLCLFMGLPKIGKSTAMAKLNNALICDLEGKGYDGIDVKALVRTTTLKELREACQYFFSADNTEYKVLVIDHIRTLTSFFARNISAEHKARFVEEVDYGRGSFQLRNTIDTFIKWLNTKLAEADNKYVFLVGHAVDKNSEIRLDIDGKNETMVLGLMDAVGFIDRDEDITTIDFKAHRGVEFGTRNPNLANYEGVLDWTALFKLAEGK